jgi:hypothetical protein
MAYSGENTDTWDGGKIGFWETYRTGNDPVKQTLKKCKISSGSRKFLTFLLLV